MCVLIRIDSLRQLWWTYTINHFQYKLTDTKDAPCALHLSQLNLSPQPQQPSPPLTKFSIFKKIITHTFNTWNIYHTIFTAIIYETTDTDCIYIQTNWLTSNLELPYICRKYIFDNWKTSMSVTCVQGPTKFQNDQS